MLYSMAQKDSNISNAYLFLTQAFLKSVNPANYINHSSGGDRELEKSKYLKQSNTALHNQAVESH